MSIASEITRINNNIANAYTQCNSKGATMPQTQNSANLSTTIASIPTGGGGSGRLPSQYQEVEYIQSSGTQYFNTGYNPSGISQYSFKFSDGTNNGVFFGSYNGAWVNGNGYYHSKATGDWEWFHYYNNTSINVHGSSVNSYEYNIDKGTIYSKTGTIIYTTSDKTFTIQHPLYILAGNWSDSRAEQPLSCKLYYFQIKENNVLLHNYVPCYRKLDNVIGLYDLVEEEFITNAGTGTFEKGPDYNVKINLQNKSVTINQNGTTTVTADAGYDGLGKVTIITNIS